MSAWYAILAWLLLDLQAFGAVFVPVAGEYYHVISASGAAGTDGQYFMVDPSDGNRMPLADPAVAADSNYSLFRFEPMSGKYKMIPHQFPSDSISFFLGSPVRNSVSNLMVFLDNAVSGTTGLGTAAGGQCLQAMSATTTADNWCSSTTATQRWIVQPGITNTTTTTTATATTTTATATTTTATNTTTTATNATTTATNATSTATNTNTTATNATTTAINTTATATNTTTHTPATVAPVLPPGPSRVQTLQDQLKAECNSTLNGLQLGSSCFFKGSPSMDQATCAVDAQQNGTQLAHINSPEIFSRITQNVTTDLTQTYWIGAEYDTSSPEQVHWFTTDGHNVRTRQAQAFPQQVLGINSTTHASDGCVAIKNGSLTKSAACATANNTVCLKQKKAGGERYKRTPNLRVLVGDNVGMGVNKTLSVSAGEDERHCAFYCLIMKEACLAFNLNVAFGICELLRAKAVSASWELPNGLYIDDPAWAYYERNDGVI